MSAMAANGNSIAAVTMDQLRVQFHLRMITDRDALAQLADAFEHRDATGAELATIRTACHKLCGSAGLFGHAEVARAAGRVQSALASCAGAPLLCSAMEALIEQLSVAAASSKDPADSQPDRGKPI
jgi:hypothetical protein